jgi:hypothetical protein
MFLKWRAHGPTAEWSQRTLGSYQITGNKFVGMVIWGEVPAQTDNEVFTVMQPSSTLVDTVASRAKAGLAPDHLP